MTAGNLQMMGVCRYSPHDISADLSRSVNQLTIQLGDAGDEPRDKLSSGHNSDDLEWIQTSPSPQTSVGQIVKDSFEVRMFEKTRSNRTEDSECLAKPVPRVQVRIHGFWRDIAREEAAEIGRHLQDGEAQFYLHARNRDYDIDFSRMGAARQTNLRSGKTRRLRILVPRPGDRWGIQRTQPVFDQPDVVEQRRLGPQSLRGEAPQNALRYLSEKPWTLPSFIKFADRERKYCGEWAVFYHSYSHAALIYEVQAAIASELFGFKSQYAPLPRLLMNEFYDTPDAASLIRRFDSEFAGSRRDHDANFRRVALSTMCSLSAKGPEVCLAKAFVSGYSCIDVPFRQILEHLLQSCCFSEVAKLADGIVSCAERHGLDTSAFGGRACKGGRPGHALQIFIRRSLVDRLAYAAHPYGLVDAERMPLSSWLNGDNPCTRGQARVIAHPEHMMHSSNVRMYTASADRKFEQCRVAFQKELRELLTELKSPAAREQTVAGIYGGVLPPWWDANHRKTRA
mmetsp:Transcript_70747/g.183618  ORF Transcript_70747/g.183618 Transcript_70747/m.183618 type:complete len:511 (+) Transcript_70747:39-1571(+)